jgi:hypothetical protein
VRTGLAIEDLNFLLDEPLLAVLATLRKRFWQSGLSAGGVK